MLETLATKITAAVAKRAASEVVAPLVRQVIAVQDAQTAALQRLHSDVQSLMAAPLKRAHLYLTEAAAAADEHAARTNLLDARTALFEAFSITHSAPVAAELSLVSSLLGDTDAARRHADAAYRGQVELVGTLARETSTALSGPVNYLKDLRRVAPGSRQPKVPFQMNSFWWAVVQVRRSTGTSDEGRAALGLDDFRSARIHALADRAAGLGDGKVSGVGVQAVRWLSADLKQRKSDGAFRLTRLEEAAAAVEEYRQLLVALDPFADTVVHVLRIKLEPRTAPFQRATITWESAAEEMTGKEWPVIGT